MDELEQTIENYLARTPSKWSKILKGAHIIKTTELEKTQAIIRQYLTATNEQKTNYASEVRGLNIQIQGLEGTVKEKNTFISEQENEYTTQVNELNTQIKGLEETLKEKNNDLDTLNVKITQGVLLEGEEAEMYKKFKENLEKTHEVTKKITQDVGTQIYRTVKGVVKAADTVSQYFKDKCSKNE